MEQQNIQAALYDLRKKYLDELPDKLTAIQQLFRQYQAEATTETRDAIISKVHQLAGSGATFGCEGVSVIAREMLDLCRSDTSPEDFIHTFDTLQERLRKLAFEYIEQGMRLLSSPREIEAPVPADSQNRPLIYILDDDEIYANLLAASLEQQGYDAGKFTSSKAFVDALANKQPAVAIVDLVLAENEPAGESIAHLCRTQHDIPVIMTSTRQDFSSRLAAVRAGASGFFTKPVTVNSLVAHIDQLCHQVPVEPYRVLLVDDDVELTELYSKHLSAVGMQVYCINQPAEVLECKADYLPDIIILDINMPEISGIELGSVIRQYDKYNHVPILFLTVDSSLKTRVATSMLGGDDFYEKPMPPELLVSIIQRRAARARNMREGSSEIKRLRQRLETLNNAADKHSIIAMTDIRGEIVYVNQHFIDLYGYEEAEILGHTHKFVSAGQHDQAFYNQLWETISAGKVWKGELINRGKDGEIFYLSTTIVPELDATGLPSKYIAISTDITPIKRLEQHLTKEATRLNLALESTNSGMWEIDVARGRTFFNESWRHFFGHDSPMQRRNGFWHELIHPDDFDIVLGSLLKVMTPGSDIVHSDHRFKNRSGGYDWVMDVCRAVDFDEKGWPTRIVGITQLINERKMMEESQRKMQHQLMQSQKLEAVGHLTAGVAHDFNNMLGAMLGYSDLLKELGPEVINSPEKYHKYLKEITTAGKRAKELIAQMLTFARLSPEQDDEEAPVTLIQPIVKEVVFMLGSSIPSTININYSIDDADIRTRILPVQLHQIFLNLAVNARDAMDEHGQIDITVCQTAVAGECTSCSSDMQGDFVEICVADTGDGIPKKTLRHIFDPFFTTKEIGKGSGMGLSVVHGVVHSLGGHIRVESEEGVCTKVYIYLPAEIATGDTAEQDAAAGANEVNDELLSGKSILVVDDEQGICAMLTDLLSMYGANVTPFSDSMEAMEAFENNPFDYDIVITDETMPKLTGLEMAQQMMALRHGFPVILCSGFNNRVDENTCREHGIKAYMRKPIALDQLIKNIDSFLANERAG